MARKNLIQLRTASIDGKVHIRFYKEMDFFRKDMSARPVIRIYRMETQDFWFNRDGAEYFNGCQLQDTEMIFQGELPCINNRKYQFTDDTVVIGTVYAYWVSAGEGEPIGPVAVKVRDMRVWSPQEENERRMQAMANDNPLLVKKRQFGFTTMNRPIHGLMIGNPDNLIALIGTIHAGESGPELILNAAERLIRNDRELLEKTGIAILPSVNIDQREKLVQGHPSYIRKNANEVDLNRNFKAEWDSIDTGYGLLTDDPDSDTYRGPYPESEDETKAVVHFIEETKPKAVYSFHWLASVCNDEFVTATAAKDDEAYHEKCVRAILPYSKGFPYREPGDFSLHYVCTAGSLPAYLYRTQHIPCFDLEYHDIPEDRGIVQDKTTYETLCKYQTMHYHGIREVMKSLAETDETL